MRHAAQFRKSSNFNLPLNFLAISNQNSCNFFSSFLVEFYDLKWNKEVLISYVPLVPTYVLKFLILAKSGISGKIDLLSKFYHFIPPNTCTSYMEFVRAIFSMSTTILQVSKPLDNI